MRWPRERLFAVTIDGKVLMNARALEDVDLAELVQREDTFVGVVLDASEVRRLREQFTDAASEAAAGISGRRKKLRHRAGSKARSRRRRT
jgi:hypothetical protein